MVLSHAYGQNSHMYKINFLIKKLLFFNQQEKNNPAHIKDAGDICLFVQQRQKWRQVDLYEFEPSLVYTARTYN